MFGRIANGAAAMALALCVLTAAPRRAFGVECADEAAVCGKREFDRGISAYQSGHFAEATEHFRNAQEFTPHPAIVFNLALAEMEQGAVSAAATDLATVIEDTRSDDKLRAKAREELPRAESRSALVTLDVPAGVVATLEVDGQLVPDFVSGARVDPGLHWIKLTAGARVTLDHSVKLDPGEHLSLTVEVKREPRPASESQALRLPPGVVYATAGLTVVLAGAAVWSGLDTLSARDGYARDLPTLTQKQAQARLDQGHLKELRTNILIGSAVLGAAATAAVGCFLVDWNVAKRRVEVGVGPSSVTLHGTF